MLKGEKVPPPVRNPCDEEACPLGPMAEGEISPTSVALRSIENGNF